MSQPKSNPNPSQTLQRLAHLESLVVELQQSEAELSASVEQWRSIVQNSPDFVALVDRDLTLVYLNRTVPNLELQDMIGTKLTEYVLPEFHDMVREHNELVFVTGEATQYEITGIGPGGTTAWYASRLGPVKVDGRVVSVVHTVRDITERKLAESARRESEEKVRGLLDAMPDAILRFDREGTCLEFKPARGGDSVGLSGNVLGKSLVQILPYAVIDQGFERFNRVLAEGQPQSIEYQHGRPGAVQDYEARFVTSGGEQVLLIVHNITQRRQAERAVLASELRFRQLVERAPVCILQVDLSHDAPVILTANRRAEVVYGMAGTALVSCQLAKLFAPGTVADLTRLIARVVQGQTVTIESHHRRADGTIFPVRVSAVLEAEMATQHMIFTVEDITVERQRRSEMEALAEERRRIAHEIHDGLAQDLSALHLRSTLWHDLVDTNPAQMHEELDELSSMLKESIGEVRRSIFALRPLSLDEMGFVPSVRQLLDSFGSFYALDPALELFGPVERIHSESELPLFRIIQESLNNVGQHANASTVAVTLDMQASGAIILTIADDGVGFPQGMEHQSSSEGRFGVQHMRERLESLGGSFSIESEPGHGTLVRAVLPTSLG